MKKFFLALLVAASTGANCQTDQLNLQKYWHYRYRLLNYFMVVGEGAGKSIPADIRNWNGTSSNTSQTLRWGEEPVYLGYYLGVLATEYKMLSMSALNTDQTLTELYYALKAVERLDYQAESSWNMPNTIDGFIIRGDIPGTFVQDNFAMLNQDIPSGQGVYLGMGKPAQVGTTYSDYYNHYLSGERQDDAPSMDIYFQLLMGYALIYECIPVGSLTFYNYISGTMQSEDFRSLAITEADLILSFLKENHGRHWEIKCPDGSGVQDGGDNAAFFAFALAKSGLFITGTDYSDIHSNADELNWQSLQSSAVLLCDPVSNRGSAHAMAMTLAAISDSWVNVSGINTTPQKLIELGDYNAGGIGACSYFDNHHGWDVFYGMLWDILHGNTSFIGNLCQAQQILNSAPWDGPFYHDVFDNSNPGWCATRRFFDDSPRQNSGKPGFNGNFNGLDYMLLFNLYYLDAASQNIAFLIPQSSPFVSSAYPYFYQQNIYGDISSPSTIYSPDFPIQVNQLMVTSTGPTPGLGDLTIYGGAQGVTLTKTQVEMYSKLTVYTTNSNAPCFPLNSYLFDPSGYVYRELPNEANNANSIALQNASPYQIKIYPNPANDRISISTQFADTTKISLEVFNSFGQLVTCDIISGGSVSTEINITGLRGGIYFVVLSNNQVFHREKLVISRNSE